jgi:hypothetical protein
VQPEKVVITIDQVSSPASKSRRVGDSKISVNFTYFGITLRAWQPRQQRVEYGSEKCSDRPTFCKGYKKRFDVIANSQRDFAFPSEKSNRDCQNRFFE